MTMTERPYSASRNPHRASLEFIRPAQTGITHGYLVETALSPTRGGLPLSANLAQALTLEAHQPRRIHARSHAIDNGYTPKRCFNTLYTALHHDAALPINPPGFLVDLPCARKFCQTPCHCGHGDRLLHLRESSAE